MGGRKGSSGASRGFLGGTKRASEVRGDNRIASEFEVKSYLNSERYDSLKHALRVTGLSDIGVKTELASLNRVPISLMQEVAPSLNHMSIAAGTSIPQTFKGLKKLPKGMMGVYFPGYKWLFATPMPRLNTRDYGLQGTVVVHEFGHHVSEVKGYGREKTWIDLHKKYYSKLPPYYRVGGPGGDYGREEFFAQTFNIYANKGRDEVKSRFGDDVATYMDVVFGTYKPKKVRR